MTSVDSTEWKLAADKKFNYIKERGSVKLIDRSKLRIG